VRLVLGAFHSNFYLPFKRFQKYFLNSLYYRPKRYCPVLVAQEGSALWGNTLTTALLHDLNWTIPFGTIVISVQKVLSGFSRATRRWSMYFPTRRSLPARPEPDNAFWIVLRYNFLFLCYIVSPTYVPECHFVYVFFFLNPDFSDGDRGISDTLQRMQLEDRESSEVDCR